MILGSLILYPSSVLFCLSQNSYNKLLRNHAKVIAYLSNQLEEIIIDYLLVLGKVTPKQCLGAILISN